MSELFKLLNRYSQYVTVGGGVSNSTIKDAELHLGYKFPPSYIHFLKDIGHLIVMHRNYFGLVEGTEYRHSQLIVLNEKLRHEDDFPKSLLVVQDNEDFGMVALDSKSLADDNEYKVVRWDYWNKEIFEICGNSFIEFVINDIEDMFSEF